MRDDLVWGLGQGVEDLEPLLSGCRDHGSDCGEGLCAVEGAEGARDFHAQLHHAQVPFGLIVGEGDCKVGDESQDVILVVAQADEQIVAWPLGFSSSGAEAVGQRRLMFVEGEPRGDDGPVFGDDTLTNRLREFGLASVLSLVLEAIGGVEQHAHRRGPRLFLDLFDGLEFA